MPFSSKAQQRWMFANKPQMAEEWAHETPNIKALPEKKKSKKKVEKKGEDMFKLNEDLVKQAKLRIVRRGD